MIESSHADVTGVKMRVVWGMLLLAFCAVVNAANTIGPRTATCTAQPGQRPFPRRAVGWQTPKIPIEHILIVMQENHTFDNYFGKLNSNKYYGKEVDGIRPEFSNPNSDGNPVPVFHAPKRCVQDPYHFWDAMHEDWNEGANDGFVKTNPYVDAMAYFDETDIPYYYALANRFAIADRYFSSVLGPTFPNRFYLMAGTSFGRVDNVEPGPEGFNQRTIFDVLSENGITWKYYKAGRGYLDMFQPISNSLDNMATHLDLKFDLETGTLPQVSLIDFEWDEEDEHPDQDVQVGQQRVAERISWLINSPAWKSSALFMLYDEGGGFFDHVPPPPACEPDAIAPVMVFDTIEGKFDRYGFRVPMVLVSPYAKRHFVSHTIYDHTSVLKFIETKFNLPAMTVRDANANDMLDMFDFKRPQLDVDLPSGEMDHDSACKIRPHLKRRAPFKVPH